MRPHNNLYTSLVIGFVLFALPILDSQAEDITTEREQTIQQFWSCDSANVLDPFLSNNNLDQDSYTYRQAKELLEIATAEYTKSSP